MNIHIQQLKSFQGHQDAIYSLIKGINHDCFLSGSGDKSIIKWQLENNQTAQVLAKASNTVYDIQYLKNGPQNSFVIGDNAGNIYDIDLDEKIEKNHIKLPSTVFQMVQSGNVILALTADGWLFSLLKNNFSLVHKMQIATGHLRCACMLNSGEIAIGASDGTVSLLHSNSYEIIYRWKAHNDSVFSIYAKGNLIITGGKDAHLKSWHWINSKVSEINAVPAHLFTINHIIPLPNFNLIATASRDKSIKLWEPDTLLLKKVIDRQKFPQAHTHSVNRLLYFQNQNQLLSAGDDRVIRSWQLSGN